MYANVNAEVTGWGKLQQDGNFPNLLQAVTVKTMTNDKCKEQNGADKITPKMICASGDKKDSCQGDSGGNLRHK